MITLHFSSTAAENRGVQIEAVFLDTSYCHDSCSCNYGADYCDQPRIERKTRHGYKFTLPTGLTFRAFQNNQFDCSENNQEAQKWFLDNVRGSFLSY